MAQQDMGHWFEAMRSDFVSFHDWRRESRWAHQVLLIAGWVAVMAVLAQVRYPLPWTPVPFTMQVFGVLLGGVLLGTRNGAIAQVAYVGIGAAGVPWFQGFGGGMSYMTLGTGGYLLAFPVASALVSVVVPRLAGLTRPGLMTALLTLLAMLVGVAVIYAGGFVWLVTVTGLTLKTAFVGGVVTFVPFDLAKAVIATMIALPFLPTPAKR